MKSDADLPPYIHWLCALAIVACTLLAYANSFDAEFVYDDFQNFADNAHVHWYELDADRIVEGVLAGPTRRPVAIFTFGINFWIGEKSVVGYHVFNFTVHALNAIAVYALVLLTLQLPGARRRGLELPPRSTQIACALVAALLFALHPLQTQSVTYVVQRMNSMATGFSLAAFLVYVGLARGAVGVRRWLAYGAIGLLYALGVGSKEIAAPLPLALWLYEWFFGQRLDAGWARRQWPWLLPPLLIFAGGFVWLYDSFQAEFARRDLLMSERALTQLRVVFFYASLVLAPLPSRQNLLQLIPTSHSLLDPVTTLLSALGLIATGLFVVWLARRRPLAAFGVLWFFLYLVIESSFLPLEMIYEHRTYLPMVGVSLIATDLLLSVPAARRRDAFLGAAAVLFALGCLTLARNDIWRTAEGIWADVYLKTGDSRAAESVSWAIESQGLALAAQGRDRDALAYFRKATRIAPEYPRAHRSWGESLTRLGRMQPASARYRRAIELNPDDWRSHSRLAFALVHLRQVPQALASYQNALRLMPLDRSPLRTPRELAERGFGNEAILLLENGLQLQPRRSALRRELADLYLRVAFYERALPHLLLLIDEEPNGDGELRGQLGLALWELGNEASAVGQLEAAYALAPDDPRHVVNLAWMLATASDAAQRNPARALALIEPVTHDLPDDADAIEAAAAALAALGRWDEAVATVERALQAARSQESPERIEELTRRLEQFEARQPVLRGSERA